MKIPDVCKLLADELIKYPEENKVYNNIDFLILGLAHIRTECDYNERCVTFEPNVRDFSLGLCQGRIDTARWVMHWEEVKDVEIMARLMDPKTAVEFLYRYIMRQCKRYNGHLKRMICAYNAGSARYDSNGDYINQEYVDRVLKYYNEYKANPPCPIQYPLFQ